MKSKLVRAALAVLALSLSATAALAAASDPIVGVPIGLEGDPGSIVVARGVTDDKGQVSFGNLAPGTYMLVIDGKGLALTLKKIGPKGLPHTIGVVFGLADQKPIVVTNQPYNGAEAASIRVSVIVTDPTDTVGNAKTKPHNYVGIVSLVK